MGRIAPVLSLLALAACAGEPSAPRPQTIPAPPPVMVPMAPPTIAANAARRGYAQEVDELFSALPEQDAQAAAAARVPQASPVAAIAPVAIYTVPRVPRQIPAADPYVAQRAAYQENLTTCLDGRYPAFCDHDRLTAYDTQRVSAAEYQANLAICIDPQWQHLCRPELLPDNARVTAYAPRQAEPISRSSPPSSAMAPRYHPAPPAPAQVSPAPVKASVQPAAVRTYQPTWQPAPPPPVRYAPGCGENGSCYGDISRLTGRPKTTHVRGYYRRDGTYVRSHYRSKRR